MTSSAPRVSESLSQIGAFNLDVLLALATVFLGLALAVEVIQELYKFVTTSKARAYRIALIDFVGKEIDNWREDRTLGEMLLRGPFQWLTRQRPIHLLPANAGQLVRALERTAAQEVQHGLQALRGEAVRQGSVPRNPSPALCHWFEQLEKTVTQSPCAHEIVTHLDGLGVTVRPNAKDPDSGPRRLAEQSFDAASVLDSLYQRFLPKAKVVEREFDQFSANFDYAYRRRNLRQTLMIAFLLALLLDLPLGALYRQSRSLSPEQVTQLAESALRLEESIRSRATAGNEANESRQDSGVTEDGTKGEESATGTDQGGTGEAGTEPGAPEGGNDTAQRTTDAETSGGASEGGSEDKPATDLDKKVSTLLDDLDRTVNLTLSLGTGERVFRPIWQLDDGKTLTGTESLWNRINWQRINEAKKLPNLLQCLATAILIAFGAPFWHRLSKALLAVRRPGAGAGESSARPDGGE